MARQKLGEKKLARLRVQTGLDIIHGWVRGGTDHRIDLGVSGGEIFCLYSDCSIENSTSKWNAEPRKDLTLEEKSEFSARINKIFADRKAELSARFQQGQKVTRES